MRQRVWKFAAWAAVIAVSLAVFALYTRPQMMVTLTDFVWACFN